MRSMDYPGACSQKAPLSRQVTGSLFIPQGQSQFTSLRIALVTQPCVGNLMRDEAFLHTPLPQGDQPGPSSFWNAPYRHPGIARRDEPAAAVDKLPYRVGQPVHSLDSHGLQGFSKRQIPEPVGDSFKAVFPFSVCGFGLLKRLSIIVVHALSMFL